MTTIDSPDIESLIAEFRTRHRAVANAVTGVEFCATCGVWWPCPDRLLIDALVPVYEAARAIRDAVEPVPLGTGMRSLPHVGDHHPLIAALRAALAGRSVTPDGR